MLNISTDASKLSKQQAVKILQIGLPFAAACKSCKSRGAIKKNS